MSSFYFKVQTSAARIDYVLSDGIAERPAGVILDRLSWAQVQRELPMVRVPWVFFIDHMERSLPTPEEVKADARSAWVRLDDPALPELLDDARHYAHTSGPDLCSRGLIASAKATVAAIEKAQNR